MAAGLLGVAPAMAARAPAWSVVPSPSALVRTDQLAAVSCASARACTAVGSSITPSDGFAVLVKAWNGRKWTVQRVPAAARPGRLAAVSCTSARMCIAVGEHPNRHGNPAPLAEHWNGRKWAIQHVPAPATSAVNVLSAVSCSSATHCVAVGTSGRPGDVSVPIAERWNGRTWALQRIPRLFPKSGNSLSGVSCTSARMCIAVGNTSDLNTEHTPVAERWNGRKWTLQSVPDPAGSDFNDLNAISCSSASACITVGSAGVLGEDGVVFAPLAERWNGRTWALQPIADPVGGSSLTGMSCTSASACTAVGGSGLAERWNGATWTAQATPTLAGSDLSGVSCTRAGCTAVGSAASAPSGARLTLAARWNGTTWAVQPTPGNPAGAQFNSLTAVSCSSASACTAVGFDRSSGLSSRTRMLAERWNGRRWLIQPLRLPAGAASSTLIGISCASATTCMAIGNYQDQAGPRIALTESWNGATWTVQSVPGGSTELSGIACTSPTACIAVGSAVVGTADVPVAESWDGTKWQIRDTPDPAGNGSLSGVSCTSASECTAVGFTGGDHLALHWDGVSWSVESAPRDAVSSVSCSSADACMAVGGNVTDRWNGTRWIRLATPVAGLSGVSCTSASACMAVGSRNIRVHGVDNGPYTLIEHWNGRRWVLQHPRAFPVELSGVSCTCARACMAVGVKLPARADGSRAGTLVERYS